MRSRLRDAVWPEGLLASNTRGYVGWNEKRHPSKREALLEDAGNVQGVETRRVGQGCEQAKAVVVLKELVHARGCMSKMCGPSGM